MPNLNNNEYLRKPNLPRRGGGGADAGRGPSWSPWGGALTRTGQQTRFALTLLLLFILALTLLNAPAFPVRAASTGAHAHITLSPTSGPPTTHETVTGRRFGSQETILITFDSAPITSVTTNKAGSFIVRFTIPASATPGQHLVQATEHEHGHIIAATAPFLVQTNWSMFGFDPQHTHYNPYENVLSPSNVSKLTLAWSYTTGLVIDHSSPAVANGIAYIGSDDNKIYALDARTGVLLWSYNTGSYVFSSPAVDNGIVYVGSENAKLYAFNARTGALLWSYTTGGNIFSSPTIVNEIVYIGSGDGNVYALSSRTGKLLWIYKTNSGWSFVSSVAVANGVVYIGSQGSKLYALNAQTGVLLWSYTMGWYVESSPAVMNGVVYVGSYDGKLYAFNAQTGALLWSVYFPGSFFGNYIESSPAVVNGVVYVGSHNGVVYALNAQTGALLWRSATGWRVSSSPAVANGVVYIGSWDNKLYALDAQTGARLWSHATGNAILSSPAVANGIVYIASYDGSLYAFHLPGQQPT